MRNANRAKWEGAGASLAWLRDREGPHLWPSSTTASWGIFLTHFSEIHPPLLKKAPRLWPRAKSWLIWLPFRARYVSSSHSSLLACIPTPPNLFIHSFIHSLLSPLKDAGGEAVNETGMVPSPMGLNIKEAGQMCVGSELGCPGPHSGQALHLCDLVCRV